MSRRFYILCAVSLVILLAATTALGAGLGKAVSLLFDNHVARLVALGLGTCYGFLAGAAMCSEIVKFGRGAIRRYKETGEWTSE